MDNTDVLKRKASAAPDSPGVYLMSDRQGRVIYVGKAKSLKKRILNYFGSGMPAKTRALMSNVRDIRFCLAPSEEAALLLEFNLIHKFRPRYNVSLKDDKSFPLVKISREDFPVVQITRKKDDPEAVYLGPYTDAKLLKEVLKIIRHEFPYRSCRRIPVKSCIYHRIKLCPAPCAGMISIRQYRKTIGNITMILEGKAGILIRKLTRLMRRKSASRDFESAALIRDQIVSLSRMSGRRDDFEAKNELELLKESLGLAKLPLRIEGFDISNISGKQATGSMVSFFRGRPDKDNYRRFRIKGVAGIDDYKMLAEVLRRRYTRLLEEKKPLPDLLLIDGGKGHLLTAAFQLEALHLNIPLVSIAKKNEDVYSSQPGKGNVFLVKDGAALNLIRRIRDEAHRFALAYHHLLRRKEFIKK